jgi:hypothetical protein
MRSRCLAVMLIAVAPGARGAEPDGHRTWKEDLQERVYLAPGLQFGARSQELTLTVGRATVTYGVATVDQIPFEDSLGFGIASRIELNATWQATVGSSSPRPAWFSNWLFGVRYGFDVVAPRRQSVTIESQ